MISIYGFISAVILCLCLACQDDCTPIGIGIIAKGSDVTETDTFSRHGRTFKIIKRLVDTSEVYDIYRSVQRFDEDVEVDIIILMEYDTTVLMTPNILTTNNKKLLKMGASNTQKAWREKKTVNEDTGLCDVDDNIIHVTSFEDIYCIKNLNTTHVDRDEVLISDAGPRALRFLIRALGWSSVVILYESATEIETSAVIDGLSKDGVLFALFNIDHVIDIKSLLLEIYQRRANKETDIMIMVVCRFRCVKDILQSANKVDSLGNSKTLLKKFSRWLVLVYDHTRKASHVLRNCANDLDNVAIIAIPEFTRTSIESVCDIIETSLLKILLEAITISSGDEFKKAFINEFEKTVQTWNPWNKCKAYNIDTLLWTNKGREFSSVGYADIKGNVVLKSDIFLNTKYGYNKRKFLISTLEYPPFVIKREVNNTYIFEGFCMDLLDELAHTLNFTYNLTETPDRKWGTYTENFTYNGLVGQLQREEVDIVAAPVASQAERSPFMDFSYSFYYEYTTVVVKKPDVNATKWRTLLDPFKWEVLVAIGLSLVVVTILTFLLEKYNPFYNIPEHAENRAENGGLHTWHSSFWYIFGALLCQGGVHLPESTSGRTLISFWWLTCIIIVGTYCGNLIAFLTVTKERPPFNTLQELLELKGTYKWGTLGGTSWETAFPTSSNPTFKAIGEAYQEFSKSDPDILNVNLPFHIKRVKEGNYAWIGDKTYIEISMAKECSLMSIKEEFMPLIYVFGFTNSSPHTAVFSEQMIKIHEGGLFQIWKRKWWPKSNFCAGNTAPEAKPISLMDVQSAFYICLLGVVVGSLAFLIEIVLFKCRKHLQNSELCAFSSDVSRDTRANESKDIETSTSTCQTRL